jgi:maltose-binding protein MalE
MEQIFSFAGQKVGQDAAVCALPGQQPDLDMYKSFRFARAAFTFALSAGAASPLIAAAAEKKLFTAGVGESGADAGWPWALDEVDTDAGEAGGSSAIPTSGSRAPSGFISNPPCMPART